MEILRRFFSIYEVRGGNFLFERGVTQIWSLVCIAKLIICLVWIKKKCLVNSKVKGCCMWFYVICMNKHVGITLSVFLLVLYTGARGRDHPPPFF
jgi:FtsH-binding integral membrane protein